MADGDGQLPLLPPGDDGGAALRRAVEGPRGPGRPAGSPNRRTEALVGYMLQRYRSPLEALAAVAMRPTGDLVRDLLAIVAEHYRAPADRPDAEPPGVSFGQVLEALRLQVAAARELAPYLHQKQPTAVEIDASGAIPIGIFLSPESASGLEHALAGDRLTIDATLSSTSGGLGSESEENQGLGDVSPADLDKGDLDSDR